MKNIIYQGVLDGEFNGFDSEMLFKTADGQYWLQDEYVYWYHYAYRPDITIYDENGATYLSIEDKKIQIRRLLNVIESNVDGDFNGWDGESVYTLRNGQKWAQAVYKYEYKYAYSPSVVVYESSFGTLMNVAGTTAKVKKIN
ncbi:hypothetical protein HXC64_05285 [Listeria monocytogenes]|nr:hypothetical protein [Listeria monocytogenes]